MYDNNGSAICYHTAKVRDDGNVISYRRAVLVPRSKQLDEPPQPYIEV